MMNNKIGVISDSFKLGLREGLAKAREMGADGVQLYAVAGEMDTSPSKEKSVLIRKPTSVKR